MSLYSLVTVKNLQRVLLCSALLFICFTSNTHKAEALYSQGVYYAQSSYYSQSGYSSYSYSQSSYYRQASYYTQGTYYSYSQGSYYSQSSYYNQSSYSSYSYNQSSYYRQSSYYNQSSYYRQSSYYSGYTYSQSAYYNPTAKPTCTLTATPKAITAGQSSKLAWTTTNATYVTLTKTGGGAIEQPKSGTTSVFPISSYTYKLEAANIPVGSVDGNYPRTTCLATVTVSTSTPAVTTFTANPTSGAAPLTTKFTVNVAGSPFGAVVLDYGDGTKLVICGPGSGCVNKTALHTYANIGTFTATLSATGEGSSQVLKTLTIAPYPQPNYYTQSAYTSGTVLGISTDVLAEIMAKLQAISAEIKKLQQ